MSNSFSKALAAEGLGTALLLAAVVGSGIMAERLTSDMALALLCNTLATGAILFVLIVLFAGLSGAHFNPAVTLAATLRREISAPRALAYIGVQIIGAILGVWLAHLMFEAPVFMLGVKARIGMGQWLAEFVATFGLVLLIAGAKQRSVETIAAAVGLYITAAYWFTASTSFANPAVTLARALTPTFAGIRPADAPAFIAAEIAGAFAAVAVSAFLFPPQKPASS
jgi:glycerol uptake facilitator-like aquaporin